MDLKTKLISLILFELVNEMPEVKRWFEGKDQNTSPTLYNMSQSSKEGKLSALFSIQETIREKNGIPFSSRNLLLNSTQKKIASNIYKFIKLNYFLTLFLLISGLIALPILIIKIENFPQAWIDATSPMWYIL